MDARWVLAAVLALTATGASAQPANFPDITLPRSARGAGIIDALGDNLASVAAAYRKTPEELKAQAKRDKDLHINSKGKLFYTCKGLASLPANSTRRKLLDNEHGVGDAHHDHHHHHHSDRKDFNNRDRLVHGRRLSAIPTTDAFLLHSRSTATRKIYLDFNGHTTSGTDWNLYNACDSTPAKSAKASIVCPAFSYGDSTFTRNAIIDVWAGVAEDFSMFHVDVTTQDPGIEGLRKTSSTDTAYGVRVVISPCSSWCEAIAGIAFPDTFDGATDLPLFAFSDQNPTLKGLVDTISHETGHTLGLSHDGLYSDEYWYSTGQYGAIMGFSDDAPLAVWSKGEYNGATNTEDDFAVMNYYLSYRTQNSGNDPTTAANLNSPCGSTGACTSGGNYEIKRSGELDYYVMSHAGGAVTIKVDVATSTNGAIPGNIADLDVKLELRNSANTVIATANPSGTGERSSLIATYSNSNLAAGKYYITVRGTGWGDPKTTGWSSYASVGQYYIAATFNVPPSASFPTFRTWAPSTTLPTTTTAYDFGTSYITSGLSSTLVSTCPDLGVGLVSDLTGTVHRKHVWKISPMPSATTSGWTLDTCDYSAGSAFDTVMAVIRCTEVTPGKFGLCSCYAADDSCPSGDGSRVTGIGRDSAKAYFAVVLAYDSAVISGKYKMKLWPTDPMPTYRTWSPTVLPTTSAAQDFAYNTITTAFTSQLASKCPVIDANIRGALTSINYRKHIWRITIPTNTRTTYQIDTCDPTAGTPLLDTMLAVFQCTQLTTGTVTDCTCLAVDDDCASGGGSKLASIPKTTKGYFAVITSYDAGITSGFYKLKIG